MKSKKKMFKPTKVNIVYKFTEHGVKYSLFITWKPTKHNVHGTEYTVEYKCESFDAAQDFAKRMMR